MNQPTTLTTITAENPEVVAVRSNLATMEAQALALAIVDDESSATATDMLKHLRTARKTVEEKQDGVTKPLNEALKAARGIFKPIIEKYEGIEKNLKDRQLNYLSEKARKAEEEARRLQKEAEERALREAEEAKRRADEQKRMIEEQAAKQAEQLRENGNEAAAEAVEENAARAAEIVTQSADNTFTHVVEVAHQASQPQYQRTVRTDSGNMSSLKKVWDYEVTDIKALPAEFLQVNASAVREHLRRYAAGEEVKPLDGVRYFQKDQLAVR